MSTPDHQRLTQLQALTQSASAPRPPTSEILRGVQQQATPNPAADEPEDDFAAETHRSTSLEDDDIPSPTPSSAPPRASFPLRRPQPTTSSTPPVEFTQRVQQAASTTLELRDRREFTLKLEEDTSRDDALIERLAEQTVTIIQQRDETLYNRVLQAIEQRLSQGRSTFS